MKRDNVRIPYRRHWNFSEGVSVVLRVSDVVQAALPRVAGRSDQAVGAGRYGTRRLLDPTAVPRPGDSRSRVAWWVRPMAALLPLSPRKGLAGRG